MVRHSARLAATRRDKQPDAVSRGSMIESRGTRWANRLGEASVLVPLATSAGNEQAHNAAYGRATPLTCADVREAPWGLMLATPGFDAAPVVVPGGRYRSCRGRPGPPLRAACPGWTAPQGRAALRGSWCVEVPDSFWSGPGLRRASTRFRHRHTLHHDPAGGRTTTPTIIGIPQVQGRLEDRSRVGAARPAPSVPAWTPRETQLSGVRDGNNPSDADGCSPVLRTGAVGPQTA
ncbi:hypothetical protein DN069_29985 [Streptacidiphilus pinicola]|uniref:Uncharacterized protein n=1 Tax=Streptacidiphilus pinicola TaxID=2219663 RepID=A0A2X0IEA3_9ACTN|nr:hypothetical protein DN069_29985 [Streptacidiphilus pinicola]